jgi:hypothetical protein
VREDGRIVGGEEWQEKVYDRGMEDAPENGKESSHSAHANGIATVTNTSTPVSQNLHSSRFIKI